MCLQTSHHSCVLERILIAACRLLCCIMEITHMGGLTFLITAHHTLWAVKWNKAPGSWTFLITTHHLLWAVIMESGTWEADLSDYYTSYIVMCIMTIRHMGLWHLYLQHFSHSIWMLLNYAFCSHHLKNLIIWKITVSTYTDVHDSEVEVLSETGLIYRNINSMQKSEEKNY